MEYIYAALILNETDAEINEENLTAVLDAAGVDVEESRVKALVAALEDVDIEDAIEQAAAVPAAGGAAAPAEGGDDSDDDSDDDAAAADEGDDDEEEEDEEASGEGLGSLFG
ncbi:MULTISPECIES: 50S ribosomal protein P1 [unclassified Haladaptatus]|uniref:50S ribosomal protein P1 n=1 Tax=unclassified Haladaptatus TaxID=2622732 RepID=UPI002FCE2A0E